MLERLSIRGIRNFGIDIVDEQVSRIRHFSHRKTFFPYKIEINFKQFVLRTENHLYATVNIDPRQKWLWQNNNH